MTIRPDFGPELASVKFYFPVIIPNDINTCASLSALVIQP